MGFLRSLIPANPIPQIDVCSFIATVFWDFDVRLQVRVL